MPRTTTVNGRTQSVNGRTVGGTDIPDTLVDNFETLLYEDQNRSLGDVYNGVDTSEAVRQQNIVQQGSYALEVGNTGGNRSGFLTDTDVLNSPSQGDSVEFYTRGESTGGSNRGPDIHLLFAVQSEAGGGSISCYSLGVRYRYNNIKIYRKDDGSNNQISATSVSLPSQTWHKSRLDWGTDNSIRFRTYDGSGTEIADISVTDSTYTSGGVGWNYNCDDRNNNGTAWADNVQII